MNNIELFTKLTMVPGVSGYEKHVQNALRSYYTGLCDEIITDNMGSIFAYKKSKVSNPKKVMIAGHMDEVGFIVSQITSTGMLKINPIGGWNPQTLLSNSVKIYIDNNLENNLTGIIASLPPHLLSDESRKTVVQIKDMLVDIGVSSYEEAIQSGVCPGCMVVVDGRFEVLANPKRLLAKAWDNRYGCILGVELLQSLQEVDLPYDLYIGATVQEEVGIRGAQTATNLINPDLAIVLDASPANDMVNDNATFGKLGCGPLIRIIDANMIPNQKLVNYAKDVYNTNNINYQYYISQGGTDAGSIHKALNGVPTLTVCLAARYIHTSYSIIDLDDYNGAKKFMEVFLPKLNSSLIEDFKLL